MPKNSTLSQPREENEMEIPEELVEEIRLLLCEDCSEGPERYEYQASLDDPICAVGAEKECRERARKIIALTLKAVVDGELDEALGVVGRYNWGGGGIEDWIGQMGREMHFEGGFIALSPSGTGTEVGPLGKEEGQ